MSKLSPDAPLIEEDCVLVDSTFGRYVSIARGSRLINVEMGDYSYCDRNADMANAVIGKFSNIASSSRIGATDHPLDTASLHHFMYRSGDYWGDAEHDKAFFDYRASRTTTIGNDTWIGHGAMIKPEVTIGHGAVVAAGALVTKDVPPYIIVAGVPAKPLRERQPRHIAERLMALEWWDWDHQRIRSSLDDFRKLSAIEFLEKYED